MDIILSTASAIAMIVCALAGSMAFTVFASVSKYEKQKTDAEKLRSKIAAEGRDPTDLASLTASEKWELIKAQKFDRIFLIADIMAVILGTGLACAVLYFYGGGYVEDVWPKYAVLGLIAGIVATWFLSETVIKTVAEGKWQQKSADAFRIVKSAVDETVKAKGGYAALVQKFLDAGLTKKEAQEMAKDAIARNPSILDEE